MADGAVHQPQPRLDGPLADGLDLIRVAQALNMGIRAEFQVDLVRIMDGLLDQVRPHQVGQIPAHLAAQGQLAVGKRACTGKARGDMAIGLAVHALAGLALGAAAVLHSAALLHNQDFFPAPLFQHLQCGEDTGGACANDDYVLIHGDLLPLTVQLI